MATLFTTKRSIIDINVEMDEVILAAMVAPFLSSTVKLHRSSRDKLTQEDKMYLLRGWRSGEEWKERMDHVCYNTIKVICADPLRLMTAICAQSALGIVLYADEARKLIPVIKEGVASGLFWRPEWNVLATLLEKEGRVTITSSGCISGKPIKHTLNSLLHGLYGKGLTVFDINDMYQEE